MSPLTTDHTRSETIARLLVTEAKQEQPSAGLRHAGESRDVPPPILYVLIPVFDNAKHYFIGEDELEKLLAHGSGWLAGHPERDAITRRYLRSKPNLVRQALARLLEELPEEPDGVDGIIGDLHGCGDELEELLGWLGYQPTSLELANPHLWGHNAYVHPAGRTAIFVGDIVDRGNRVLDCLRIVRNMVACGSAICVPGNHDVKLLKKLRGKDVQVTHGLDKTLAEIDGLPSEHRPAFCEQAAEFLSRNVERFRLEFSIFPSVFHASSPRLIVVAT